MIHSLTCKRIEQMKTIKTLNISRFYTAYALDLYEGKDGTRGDHYAHDIKETFYHCQKCGVNFRVEHQYRGGFGAWSNSYGDYATYCPYCGTRHDSFNRTNEVYHFSGGKDKEWAPKNVSIQLDEIKNGFILRARAKVISMSVEEVLDAGQPVPRRTRVCTWHSNHVEEIRFDVKARKTVFSILSGKHRHVDLAYELGAPFDLRIYKDSVLSNIMQTNISREAKEEIRDLLRALRDGIRKKWMEFHHFDIGGIYAAGGLLYTGQLLFPLRNIAFRMATPDAKNLPSVFGENRHSVEFFYRQKLMQDADIAIYSNLERFRQAGDSVTALIEAYGLPDKPSIRKAIHEDFFVAAELAQVFAITRNIDNARLIYQRLVAHSKAYGSTWSWCSDNDRATMYRFFKELTEFYSDSDIARFAGSREGWIYLRDTMNMFHGIGLKRPEAIRKVKLRDLHDYLATAQRKLRDKKGSYNLDIPESVVQRLKMQLYAGQAQFFLPEKSEDLANAAEIFHNCVAGYKERVYMQQCNIVFMTDDSGRLTACLEVKGDELIQAKLRYNKPVSQDGKVNGAVLDWCQAAGLKVKTHDVRQPMLPAVVADEAFENRMAV